MSLSLPTVMIVTLLSFPLFSPDLLQKGINCLFTFIYLLFILKLESCQSKLDILYFYFSY